MVELLNHWSVGIKGEFPKFPLKVLDGPHPHPIEKPSFVVFKGLFLNPHRNFGFSARVSDGIPKDVYRGIPGVTHGFPMRQPKIFVVSIVFFVFAIGGEHQQRLTMAENMNIGFAFGFPVKPFG